MLSYLERAQFTGVLTLLEGEQERAIYVNQGKPVHVRSPLVEETLGRLLLDEGRISPSHYEQLLELMVHTGRQAGELLISIGALGPHEVFSALEHQTCIKLTNCFRMVNFGFSLQSQAVPPALLIAKIEVRDAILDGIQQAYSLGRLLTEFPIHEETLIRCRDTTCPLGPREQRLIRQIGKGRLLADLLTEKNNLQYLVGAIYTLHALLCVEVAGVSWPQSDDLELGELGIPVQVVDPTYAALDQADGPGLLADWDSEPPPTEDRAEEPEEEPEEEREEEPEVQPTPVQTETPQPMASGNGFVQQPTQAYIHAGLVTHQLAREMQRMA